MKLIELTQGYWCKVDDEDYERLNQYNWSVNSHGYARRRLSSRGTKAKSLTHCVSMHRELLNAPSNLDVDHIDGDIRNNQKSNLRLVSNKQNLYNAKSSKKTPSGYKGVCWERRRKKWRAYIVKDNKQKALGCFDNKHRAAEAYNIAAIELFGQYARLNIINET